MFGLLAQVQPRAGVGADGRGDSAVSAIQVLCQHVAGFAVHADPMPFAARFDDFHQRPGGVLPQHLRVQRRGFAQVQRAALDERALVVSAIAMPLSASIAAALRPATRVRFFLSWIVASFCFPWKKGCAFEAAFLSASPIQRQGADVRCWRILGKLADTLETASDSSLSLWRKSRIFRGIGGIFFCKSSFFRDFLRKVYIFHTFRGCTRADFCGTIALVNHIVSEKRSA